MFVPEPDLAAPDQANPSAMMLSANSLVTGRDLRDQLLVLADKYQLIGDVRGSGLFAAVELVNDRKTEEPATEITTRVVNGMGDRGELISMIGPNANVLKIRPPLSCQRHHVDQLLQTLDTMFHLD